jgi:DNA-directed RNA polymerase subunit RPC12/RpoP
MDEKKCGDCGKELTIQEEIYYDIPSGSKKHRCQECYDKYMILLAEGKQ